MKRVEKKRKEKNLTKRKEIVYSPTMWIDLKEREKKKILRKPFFLLYLHAIFAKQSNYILVMIFGWTKRKMVFPSHESVMHTNYDDDDGKCNFTASICCCIWMFLGNFLLHWSNNSFFFSLFHSWEALFAQEVHNA